jgi:hypothetical protein
MSASRSSPSLNNLQLLCCCCMFHTTTFTTQAFSLVKDLTAGSGFTFEGRAHDLKGFPDRWHLYSVLG